ncbi:hypothetical protein [Pseudomonas sp. TE3610]
MNLKAIVDGLSPEEVVRFLAGLKNGVDYPHIDRMLTWYRSQKMDNVDVLKLVGDLKERGVIQHAANGGRYVKGVNWSPVDISHFNEGGDGGRVA